MPRSQERVYGKGHLHLITSSCHRKQPFLSVEKHRDLFARLLEEVRVKFRFKVAGYVVMPDHFHLLMTEPEIDTAANSVDMLRQRYQRRYNTSARSGDQVWETRYSDTHIPGKERVEAQLSFMHQAPVKAALVEDALDWAWSSARFYAGLPDGTVTVEAVTVPG